MDKAGKQYWDENWSISDLPAPVDLEDASLNNYVNRALHQYFQQFFSKEKNTKVLEIGCANSVWPIYFYQQYGCQIAGLDYSPSGCEKSRQLLQMHQVPGRVHYANLFNPPPSLIQQFDWVVSFGVIEHFEDTAACLKACAAFVKPGGTLFTLIPNMNGTLGKLQQWIDPKVYAIHVPLTPAQLHMAHQQAGLTVLECNYFLSINFNMINSGRLAKTRWNPLLRRALSWPTKLFWIFERWGLKIPQNRLTSPYIISIATIGESHVATDSNNPY